MAALPFGIGPMELGLIALVVLLLFGPKRLPQLGKSIGKTVKAIRDGVDGKDEEGDEVVTKAKAKDEDDDEE
jgi:sec-independent protein translocase protein TatA